MKVLGVDPGSVHTGYGVIDCSAKEPRLETHGAIHPSGTGVERLKQIYEGVTQAIKTCQPAKCAIEMPVYGLNPQSMLKLGRAQAAAMLAASHQGLGMVEYTPKEVKLSVTGNGNASKEQVAYMVRSLLNLQQDSLSLDESDALAVALCHWYRQASDVERRAPSSWAAFVRQNPGRIR